jgi:hypothetical protein
MNEKSLILQRAREFPISARNTLEEREAARCHFPPGIFIILWRAAASSSALMRTRISLSNLSDNRDPQVI